MLAQPPSRFYMRLSDPVQCNMFINILASNMTVLTKNKVTLRESEALGDNSSNT
jgi:hypothetical protein